MSWEGYFRYLCTKGHTWIDDGDTEDTPCPWCGEPVAWQRSVDQTNDEGYDPPLVMKTPSVRTRCNLGHTHETSVATWHIPVDAEQENS
jgi:hypothetical protein